MQLRSGKIVRLQLQLQSDETQHVNKKIFTENLLKIINEIEKSDDDDAARNKKNFIHKLSKFYTMFQYLNTKHIMDFVCTFELKEFITVGIDKCVEFEDELKKRVTFETLQKTPFNKYELKKINILIKIIHEVKFQYMEYTKYLTIIDY
ncbi:hypothetical protein N9K75_01780 [bacterium]|nr:hypothetical protein [bacterium]